MSTYKTYCIVYYHVSESPYGQWLEDEINKFRNRLIDQYGHFSDIEVTQVLRDENLCKHIFNAEIHITDQRAWYLMKLKNDLVFRVIRRISRRVERRTANDQMLLEVVPTDLVSGASS